MRVAWLTTLLLALLPITASAQPASPNPPPTLTREGLQADVDVLQRAYEQLHPGLHRYNTPEQMRGQFTALRTTLDRDQPLAEAYLAFSRFAASVRCGHTYANFYNQPKRIQQVLFEQGSARVPFHFRWLGKRMVVTRDLTPQRSLPAGTEILLLDGVAPSAILAALMPMARADGHNDGKRRALLQVQGSDQYETFDVFLPLLFPQIDGSQRLRVRLPDSGREADVVVAGLTHAQRQASRPERPESETAGWSLDTQDPRMAVLRMPGWALYDSKWDWKAYLQQTFEQLAKAGTPALVIDLRGNEGGLDVGDEILSHLLTAPLTMANPPARVRYRKVPEDLTPMLDTWDPSFRDWGDAAVPFDERFYTLTRWQDSGGSVTLQPRAPHFAGRVFVLVGADNSSATFQFAQQVRQSGLATLVGQPTGGNQRGINGGAFFFLRLPHSGIELDLPLIATFPAGDPPDAGLDPDILVQPSVSDIAEGRDSELDAVRKALHED